MLPGRASDAGPNGRKYCPKCDSSSWSILTGCAHCDDAVCDCCPGALVTVPASAEIVCAKCAVDL